MSFIGGIFVLLLALIVGACREAHHAIYGEYPKGCYIPREKMLASGYYEDDDICNDSGYDDCVEIVHEKTVPVSKDYGTFVSSKKNVSCDYMDGYDEYYEGLYNDAMSGDESAVRELHEEFGGDWDEEY